jgi:uncharacterized protein YndB with AHSA1/START domain
MFVKRALFVLLALTAAGAANAQSVPDIHRTLQKEVVVSAPVADVWKAWTTTEGLKTFFAPGAKVELVIGGPFEIYFNPAAPAGQRGADDCQVVAFEPMKRLAFTWNAPPQFPKVRKLHTRVVLEFEPLGERETRVKFMQDGWGWGEEWDGAYNYFGKAWDYVLGNLKKRFAEGPIEWKAR